MNFNKLSISDLIDQQLPSFVVDQFPTFVKFFEEYYKSLEIAGGLLDITDNILEYKNIDNLRKFNLVSTYKLTQAITETSDSIVLDNIDGLPPRQGVISIGNEVILYDSLHVASKTLNGCQRGFTSTTKFSETATTVSETVAASHVAGSKVTNLSNLILFLITKNYEEQYLAGFPFENISSDIGKDTLIRNIKDFYSYKGTDISIEFLFRALFEEEVTLRYPKDYVIKSSYSDWTVDDIIKVEQISGNPYDLVGNELKQTDASGLVVDTALVDQILVNNISNYASGNKNIYEIRLNVLDQSFFKIPQESILRGPLNSTATVITVDSTIGFPDLNGIVQIDNEIVTYRYKTFNQFIDCGRGAYGTVATSHANQSPLRTTEYLYGYSGSGEQIEANKITMRLLGILGGATVVDGGNYYNEGELIKLSPDGDTDNRPVFTSWRKNETGALASSSDVQLNASIKNITTGVTAVYKDETYAYVASTGLPQDPIGDFIGVGFDVRNQNHLKTIPLQPEKNTQTQYAGKKPVGLFVDGVQAYSCEDYDEIPYGSIESVNIVQSGFGFETNIQPVFRISNSTGSNATFEGEILNGKISKINITNGGSGYTQDHDLEVTYGFDATATIASDTDISKGSIKTITVTNSGQDYVATPSVEIIDITGKGKGAYAIAEVTNNQVTGIIVLNGGVDYTDKNNIRVNIISKGTGVVARAVVKKWAFDRVFKTTHSPDTNGNWGAAQTIKSDTGNGYLYPSRNVKYNLEYGYPSNPKLLRHRLIDNVQGVNANYDEKTSGFTHSPILGWAYDGNPIYGPYGYVDPYDTNSSITRQTSSYVLKTAAPANRPPTSKYPLGSFVDDYEFIQGSGSLDRNNGRFCKTPDFPEGRYCYFITVTSLGAGVFPYIIGTTFYSVPSQNNYNNEFDQSLDSNLPAGVRRIRSINTPSKGFDASLIVGEVQRGVIDNFNVYSSGDSFKKLDYLFIDNTDTEGSRAFGRVESVKGVNVPRVYYSVASGFTHPLLSTNKQITLTPSDGQTYTVGATSYPVMGKLYVPTSLTTNSIDVVVVFHGTLSDTGTQTIAEASEYSLNVFLDQNNLNVRDKIIFSAAYPQDNISQARQYGLTGVGTEQADFLMGDNLPYAQAAVRWVQNSLNGFMAANSISKTIGNVYLFGHSQGGKLVTKMNTTETGIAGVIANAPGPIQFDQTCAGGGSTSISCTKISAIHGPSTGDGSAPYEAIGLETYTSTHNAPLLFTQALDDTSGGGNQATWLQDYINAINAIPANANTTLTTVPTGGHAAFIANATLQAAIRTFLGSNGYAEIPNAPWPVDISAPYLREAGITYDIFVETATPHLLSNGDSIDLSLDRNSLQATKTFKVRVSNYQTVNYSKPVVDTELVADVAFNQNTINVISADEYREDDYLLINDEILKIVSIDTNLDQITVDRAQFGTPLRLHAATNKVSLYIPDSDQDYRIAVGDAVTSPGVSGVIYSIDKQNSSFEVRIISGSLTSSSTISDSSTPSARDITISSVSGIRTYWEIDPTNTGNHYVRDLSFRMIRGTEYRFDVSDGSNFGNKLIFTEDSTNINTLTNVEYYGTAGTVGSYIVITKQALLNFDVSRVYYYEQNNQVLNNKPFFTVLTLPSGTQTVKVLNDNLFSFNIPIQPELPEYLNLVSYTTTSQTAIGAINEILVIDGGEGYKKLPKIEGITHSQLDDAKFTYSITNGSFDDPISVISTGNRYSADTKIIINTLTGSGAVLEPVILGGRIISVNVVDPGDGYDENDTIVAVDTSCQIFAVSDSIGKIKTVRFNNYGSQFNPDRTLSKSLIFNKKVIVTDVQNGTYKLSETVTTSSGFNAKITKIQEIGSDTLLLDLEVRSGNINVGDTLTGVILQATSYVYEITEPDVVGDITGFISKVGFFDSDLGKLSSSSQKITDSYYYQDFSYVIRSTKGLSDYKKYVDETTHPLGFKLFGEVSVENDVDFEDTVTGAPFSIGFADDPYKGEVIITLPNINVESDIVFKKYEISRVNTTNLRTYTGTGGALLNFLDNQIEATQIADLSANLDISNNNYTLTTNDGNFPIDTLNTSVLIALNEVFQEPFSTGEITSISYDNSIATITTSSDHNLAITASGQTYPNQKYIHIEGVTYSGNLNFNDKFEVYDVPSSNTFRVLFNNPNGFLTNNNPAVCADVQSTVDNLTGILTTAVSVSGYQLPATNQGIWLDPATSTIVSANRHRDAADLILLNKQEIIDRANAEIAVQYPDFYYPNDPQTTAQSRYKDSYRLIQLNRQEIIDGAFAEIAIVHPTFVNPNSDKCKRDLGYFVDAISLDVHTGGNVYARKFLGQYFNSIGTSLTSNGLAGEVLESITAFNKARDLMKDAITNQLTVQDLTITADPVTGSNTDPASCADVRTNIDNLVGIVTFYLNQGSLTYPVALPAETVGTPSAGEAKCKRDLGYIVDAVIGDLKTGGNSNIVAAAQAYVDGNGNLIANGIDGEVNESVTAFNKARDLMKLALANQLYGKDFNILPDFLGTSGTIDPADVSGSIFIKGQFEYDNANLKLYEAVKEGTTFYSIFFKFVSAADDARYSYKLKDILFDGVTKEFPLLKLNGTNVVTEADENLLVFIDGVLQIYGESYIIDRSVNPNVIKFYDVYDADRQFFSYTFSKYKILNNIADEFDTSKKSFELKFGDDNILPPDTHQILVMLGGVPQVEGKSYSIVDNVLTFTEAPTKDKDCHILYFYGKTFDKTISIWNGEVFERIQDIGERTPDGCKYYSKVDNTVDIIQPGDLIKIDGETTKQIIGIEQRTLENTDNLVYTAFVYTDNSYIRGKNAVASAVVSGVPIAGGNTVAVTGTVAVSGTTGVPPVYDYQVVGFNITNPGLEYDVAPIVLFKTNCDNPGKGAEAYAEITNGKVTNIVVTNPGGGYTEAPELIFAKKYEIIRPHTPIFTKQEIVLDVGLNDKQAVPVSTGFNVVSDRDEEYLLPIVFTQYTSSNTTVLEVENKTNRETSQPGLAYVLNTFDQNKFKYEPINLNDPLAPYLGTGVTIEMMNTYAPALTIGDFETHAGSPRGATEAAIINIGLDSYISYGLTLTNSISNLATTITVTGDVSNFPPTGYLEFGDETIEYTSIAGQDFTVIRGSGSVGHSAGDYLRLAWRG